MIDLSITKDPEWIKRREDLWKPVGESLSEGLRKKEVEKIHHYFMTGSLREGEEMSDGAKFSWFPIQTPESWDYLFQYVIQNPQEFEDKFYFQFGDLSERALTFDEELAMWDYFAGDVFKPLVTSRVPVGNEKKIVSVEIDIAKILSKFNLYVRFLISGQEEMQKKWQIKIDYLLTLLKEFKDESCFHARDAEGELVSYAAYCVEAIFKRICHPKFDIKDAGRLKVCEEFISFLFEKFEFLDMPIAMRNLWEETKAKSGK